MAICKFDKSVTYGRKNHPSGLGSAGARSREQGAMISTWPKYVELCLPVHCPAPLGSRLWWMGRAGAGQEVGHSREEKQVWKQSPPPPGLEQHQGIGWGEDQLARTILSCGCKGGNCAVHCRLHLSVNVG